MATKSLSYSQEIAAPISHVYRAFATAQGLQEWLGDVVEADPRVDGRLYIWWNQGSATSGTYLHLEENQKVEFSWQGMGEPAPTRVRVSLDAKDETTKLTLRHEEVSEEGAERYDNEWTNALANLKSVLETGVDKRLYDRPMLGFFVGGIVDENLKNRLGIPVDTGIHVAGVLDGMGAQKSGVKTDDVIFSIDGKEITTFPSIGQILGQHKGGDVVDTVIYRGAEKVDLPVELSKRPVPDFPPVPEQLAELGLAAYKEELANIKAAFEDYSEEEANQAPAEGEWSAKEIVAHLLVNERWSHAAWDLLSNGDKYPGFPGSKLLVKAIAQTYDVENLLKELKFSIHLHLQLIKSLPEAYYTNKGAYFTSTNGFVQGIHTHMQQHTAQIKAALTSAREKLSETKLEPA